VTQQSLPFDVGDELLAKLRIAVDAMGLKVAAAECDLSPSQLGDALAERDRKSLRIRPLIALLRVMPADLRDGILRSLVAPFGFELRARKPMTPSEELAETRSLLAQLAPGLLPIIDGRVGR